VVDIKLFAVEGIKSWLSHTLKDADCCNGDCNWVWLLTRPTPVMKEEEDIDVE
jgi:hypothetical protein